MSALAAQPDGARHRWRWRAIILICSTFTIVPETRQAVILRFEHAAAHGQRVAAERACSAAPARA